MEINLKLVKPKEKDEKLMEKLPYQSLIGSSIYLSKSTRSHVAYVVAYSLSQFNTNYEKTHWKAGKRLLHYLKGTQDHGLTFKRSAQPLIGYADVDHSECVVDRKSYTGYVFILANGAISWKAKKQGITATSSTQAEYIALSEDAREAIHLKWFINKLGTKSKKITLYNDNQGAQKLARNPVFHDRTGHIAVNYHFIREANEIDMIDTAYQPTEEMPADILTKSLPAPKHRKFTEALKVGKISGDPRKEPMQP